MTLRVMSNGGGTQSIAALVLSAQGVIDFPIHLFANTGDNAENPETLSYVREIAMPYAKEHGIVFHEIQREWKDGRGWTLYDLLTNPKSRSIGIPLRMSNGAPGNRACTVDFKIKVIAKWMKAHGATKTDKGIVGIGISLDEFKRMRTSSGIPHYDISYPLIDLRLDRAACHGIIARAGLPIPPKSSCYFCPFHSLDVWREMKQKQPVLFQKSVDLEKTLNERRGTLAKDRLWLTRKLVPLDEAVGTDDQRSLFDTEDAACESGYCMT